MALAALLMALTVLKPSYKSELLNNISNSNAALLFRKYGILLKKKTLSYAGGGGAASHVDLGAEGDVRPPATIQQHYTCISFQMA